MIRIQTEQVFDKILQLEVKNTNKNSFLFLYTTLTILSAMHEPGT